MLAAAGPDRCFSAQKRKIKALPKNHLDRIVKINEFFLLGGRSRPRPPSNPQAEVPTLLAPAKFYVCKLS